MELSEAIHNRRSIRKFTDYVVTDEELTAVMDAARWAPSWANSQVWQFIVIRDKELIKQVTGTYVDMNPATKCSLAASALIVACAKTGVSGCYGGQDVTKFSSWYMFDLGTAVQNLCLKAHELGLGTVIVGFLDHDACGKLLGLPDDCQVVATLPIGKPVAYPRSKPPRKDLKDFVYLNTFENPF